MNACVSLCQSSNVINTVFGNFLRKEDGGELQQQDFMVVARSDGLDLYLIDSTGRMILLCSTPLFAVVREIGLVPCGGPEDGGKEDKILISSDSGSLSLVRYVKKEGFM